MAVHYDNCAATHLSKSPLASKQQAFLLDGAPRAIDRLLQHLQRAELRRKHRVEHRLGVFGHGAHDLRVV